MLEYGPSIHTEITHDIKYDYKGIMTYEKLSIKNGSKGVITGGKLSF